MSVEVKLLVASLIVALLILIFKEQEEWKD